MVQNKKIKVAAGAHAAVGFSKKFLLPLFDAGTITQYPGAAVYAICYGELCAYSADKRLLAIWSAVVPDCQEDIIAEDDYAGSWEVQK